MLLRVTVGQEAYRKNAGVKKKAGHPDSGSGYEAEAAVETDYWETLKKYCIGYIGMSLRDYNNITYSDLMIKIDGFQDREQYTESMFRRVGYSARIAPHVHPKDTPKTEAKYWPMKGDKVAKETYSFQEKKEAFKELLDLVQNGAVRN